MNRLIGQRMFLLRMISEISGIVLICCADPNVRTKNYTFKIYLRSKM